MHLDDKALSVASLFSMVSRETDIKKLLLDILTPWEVEEIYDRVRILRHLHLWESQRDIAHEIGTSVTTVSRWSKLLKHESRIIHKLL